MKLSVVLLLIHAVLQQNEASTVSIRNPVQNEPSHLLVTDTGVLVSVQDKLVVLNVSTFSYLMTYSGYDTTQSSIAAILPVEDTVMVCLHSSGPRSQCSLHVDYMHCGRSDASECLLLDFSVGSLREGASSLTKIDNFFYSASSGGSEIDFSYFQLTGIHTVYSLKTITNELFGSRKFVFSFFYDGHIYFVALDSIPGMSREIKLMRACHINNMTSIADFESMFEVKLDCGALSDNVTIVSHFRTNQTLILGLSDGRWSRLCGFSLMNIDSKIMQAYRKCSDGDYTFQLSWLEQSSSCSGFFLVRNFTLY